MSVQHEELRFPGHGQHHLGAWLTLPEPGERSVLPGIVLVHEVFGLDSFVRDVAERLAGVGYAVLAPDLYSRSGTPGPVGHADEPAPEWSSEQIRDAVQALPDRQVLGDLEAAAVTLGDRERVDRRRLAVVGFCMGGNYAFQLGCTSNRVAAAVDFYGRIRYGQLSAEKPNQPLELALNLSCPLLGFFGEQDAGIPAADVEEMKEVLTRFARDFELHSYPGAGHGFFNHRRTAYDGAASQDAWERMLEFLGRSLEP